MMKLKKLSLSLGALAIAIAPIATVVACGTDTSKITYVFVTEEKGLSTNISTLTKDTDDETLLTSATLKVNTKFTYTTDDDTSTEPTLNVSADVLSKSIGEFLRGQNIAAVQGRIIVDFDGAEMALNYGTDKTAINDFVAKTTELIEITTAHIFGQQESSVSTLVVDSSDKALLTSATLKVDAKSTVTYTTDKVLSVDPVILAELINKFLSEQDIEKVQGEIIVDFDDTEMSLDYGTTAIDMDDLVAKTTELIEATIA